MASNQPLYTLLREEVPTEVVELGDGKRFVKQLVKFDNWVHPHGGGKRMKLDRDWAEKVAKNFNDKVVGRVPVPLGHPKTSAELAQLNRGWLEDLEIRDDGMYGVLAIKDADAAKRIEDDLVDQVSVSWDENYVDKLSGENVGPALVHVGLLPDPYLKGMKPFEALSDKSNVVMLSEKESVPMSVKIKNDREFDVPVKWTVDGQEKTVDLKPGEEIELPEDQSDAVAKQLAEATKPESEDEKVAREAAEKEAADKAAQDKADAEAAAKEAEAKKTEQEQELEETKKQLADAQAKLALSDAETKYNELLHEGKVTPAQKDTYIQLSTVQAGTTISLSDGSEKSLSDLVANLMKAGSKYFNLGEKGVDGNEGGETQPWDGLSKEEQAASAALGVTAETYNKVHAKQ